MKEINPFDPAHAPYGIRSPIPEHTESTTHSPLHYTSLPCIGCSLRK